MYHNLGEMQPKTNFLLEKPGKRGMLLHSSQPGFPGAIKESETMKKITRIFTLIIALLFTVSAVDASPLSALGRSRLKAEALQSLNNLKQLGITEFDGVVIAIGDNIQASIITALNCKEMGCNYIVAKAQNAKHARVLEKIGVDYVIIPEADSAIKTARLLTQPQISDIVSITSNYSIAQVNVPDAWAGRKLSEMDLRNRYDVNVLIVITKAGVNSMPSGDTVFSVGDKMLVTGPTTGVMYVTVDEIHDDTHAVTTAQKGTRVAFKVPGKVRPSDKLFKIIKADGQQTSRQADE